ncbi:MAG: DUF2336 domain-containing protein [Alphaproteobacteria bacterium]|nr:DUF2336 domain-containing protein [Alphaproteobacteria bacterium]
MNWRKCFSKTLDPKQRYERDKITAFQGTPKQRLSLAKRTDTNKEILFYLAENDPDPKVRKAVAKNIATPVHASRSLAIDGSADVRMELANRLVKLLPDLSVDTQSQLYAYAVQALGTLALDEVLKIRKSLASTLKDHAYAPPAVAAQLARDIEREVSEPILRFCVALKDDDLIEILSNHPAAWAAEAVAKRSKISALVSKAVIKTGHKKAGILLLRNKGADINEDVLETIIERAKEFPEWHEPLVKNHALPPEMARQLSRFVDARVRKLLEEKGQYDLQTTEIVADATRRRIELADEINKDKSKGSDNVVIKVNQLLSEGRLTEEVIADYVALRDEEFLIAALACLTGAKRQDLGNLFKLKKPQMICSVCWKAGLSMRFAFRLQQEVAHIAPKDLVYPRGGTDYPLDIKEMKWQLEFLGIE